MKRYYSHYTYIHPDIFLKNSIVETDDECRITRIFPFDREIERTEFYSGLLLFLQEGIDLSEDMYGRIKDADFISVGLDISLNDHYSIIIHKEDFISGK